MGLDETRNYQLIGGHIVYDEGRRRVLLDTGSPESFGKAGDFEWNGERVALSNGAGHPTVEQISRWVGTPVDVLLGGDLLAKTGVTIDAKSRRVHFGCAEVESPFLQIPIEPQHGLPIVRAEIGGQGIRGVFDTGAFVSYVLPHHFGSTDLDEEIRDFHPVENGFFNTHGTRLDVSIASTPVRLRCARPTDKIAALMRHSGLDAILGTELFEMFPMIQIDYARKFMALTRAGTAALPK